MIIYLKNISRQFSCDNTFGRYIFFGIIGCAVFSMQSGAIAQVTPDRTLGNESSSITLVPTNPTRTLIDGGAQRNQLLFHSFDAFSVGANQSAYFRNPVGVDVILSRVTGTAPSDILGTLGVDGPADLILLNPNGILFGPDARLDIAGSFTATTADSLLLDGYEFSAIAPTAPPLLSLDITPGLQYGLNDGTRLITNQGNLSVGNQQSLVLQGGTIGNTGSLAAPGGNVTLAGDAILLSEWRDAIATSGSIITTSTDPMVDSGDISLSAVGDISVGPLDSRSDQGNGGNITVTSEAGAIATAGNLLSDGNAQAGHITLTAAGDIDINGKIVTDISATDGTVADFSGRGGDITVRAGGDLMVRSPGPISRLGDIGASGLQSGTITLSSGGRFTADNVRIVSRLAGDGVGGDIRITAQSMAFNETSIGILTRDESLAFLGTEQDAIAGNVVVKIAEGISLLNSQIFNTADFGTANGGNLILDARSLQIIREPGFDLPVAPTGYGLSTFTDRESTGRGGDLRVIVTDSIELLGPFPGPFISEVNAAQIDAFLQVAFSGVGILSVGLGPADSGDLFLAAKNLTLRNGAGISTSALLGNGGDLDINVDDLNIRGLAGLATTTSLAGQAAGNLNLQAHRTRLSNGGIITTASISPGDAGTLFISTDHLRLLNGSSITTAVRNSGNGGRLTIRADSIGVIGTSADGSFSSGISANSFGEGDAGALEIESDRLFLRDGGEISTATLGSGAGADITIDTRTLQLENGQINASTTTGETGGIIRINARESVGLSGSGFDTLVEQVLDPAQDGTLTADGLTQGILTITSGAGDAGSVTLTTPRLRAENGALVATTTFGSGAGGNITITANQDLDLENSLLATGTFTDAPSGAIALNTRRLRASGGAQALTATFAEGRAGDLTVQATESIDLIDPTETGIASGLFASSLRTASGTGGDIRVTTGDFRIIDGATVTVSGAGEGDAGNIEIGARSLSLDRGFITATSASGEGGNIRLDIDEALILANNSEVSTTAGLDQGGGNGGNITISGGVIAAVGNSDIKANAFEGNGGNITITTPGLFNIEFRDRLTAENDITASSRFGVDGIFTLDLTGVEPDRAVAELPSNLTDASRQIVSGCPADRGANFVVTGRGGLPPDPRQQLEEVVVTSILDTPLDSEKLSFEQSNARNGQITRLNTSLSTPVTEAQGWHMTDNGAIELLASNSRTFPSSALTCGAIAP